MSDEVRERRATAELDVALIFGAPPEAEVVGPYRILELLGVGGTAAVFGAEHVDGRKAAIKILSPECSGHEDVRRRFLDEALVARAIRHDGIVDIFDVGELRDGRPYYVMERLDGAPLSAHIAQPATFEVHRAVVIARCIADALVPAHAVGVIHRDLKPDNVFVREIDGHVRVKLIDFGFAAHALGHAHRPTLPGTVLGTLQYMAPEQALGFPATAAVDVYTLGVVLFEMLTRSLPFARTDDPVALAAEKLNRDPISLSERRMGLPAELVGLVDACLIRTSSARIATMQRVRDRLVEIERLLLSGEPGHTSR